MLLENRTISIVNKNENVSNVVIDPNKKISYDAGGKIVSANGISYKSGDKKLKFTYRNDGTRLSKTVNGEKTEYILNGSTILAEVKESGERLNYYYSGNGTLLEIGYVPSDGDTEKFYVVQTNNFGDIEALYNEDGTLVGGYSYDPYGAILNIDKKNDPNNILEKNPFRYRGYYYDTETGWYYLNSRYYDPMVKRFVSRDSARVLASGFGNRSQYNLFAYCLNDPIDNVDHGGHFTMSNTAKFAVGGALTIAAIAGIAIFAPAAASVAVGVAVASVGTTLAGGCISQATGGSFVDGAADGALIGGAFSVVAGIGGAALAAGTTATAVEAWKFGVAQSWYAADGSIYYPQHDGAIPGTEVNMTLKAGDMIGRYGNIGPKSDFVTQTGVDAARLALPPNTNPDIYQEFEVIKDIPGTIQAKIAPWGGSLGGGLQYKLPLPIKELLEKGYIIKK